MGNSVLARARLLILKSTLYPEEIGQGHERQPFFSKQNSENEHFCRGMCLSK